MEDKSIHTYPFFAYCTEIKKINFLVRETIDGVDMENKLNSLWYCFGEEYIIYCEENSLSHETRTWPNWAKFTGATKEAQHEVMEAVNQLCDTLHILRGQYISQHDEYDNIINRDIEIRKQINNENKKGLFSLLIIFLLLSLSILSFF